MTEAALSSRPSNVRHCSALAAKVGHGARPGGGRRQREGQTARFCPTGSHAGTPSLSIITVPALHPALLTYRSPLPPNITEGGGNDLPPCRRLEGLLLPSLPYCLCFAAEISVGRGEGGLRAALPLVSLYMTDATQPLPLLVVLSIPGTRGDELFPGSSPIRTGK